MSKEISVLHDVSDWAIVQNWLKLNHKMAQHRKQLKQREEQEIKKHIKVNDLKKVWDEYFGEGE